MKVRFAPRALAEAKRRKTWWLQNRQAAPELFESELAAMLSTLTTTPNMGKMYEGDGGISGPAGALEEHGDTCFGLNGDELVVYRSGVHGDAAARACSLSL